MPSATIGSNVVQSASPELASGNHSEAMKQVLGMMDKKVRNMEKKKAKLDDYQTKKSKGERLNQDQLDALTKFQEVINNLDFARELQKSFLTLGQDIQKAVKKAARREQLQREEMEQRRLKNVLELQFLLDRLGEDGVRQDLKRPDASATPLLSDADLTALDEFYKLVGPERDHNVRLTEQYEEASLHLLDLLEGRDKAVAGTTYKGLKETLDKVLLSGYFDRAQPHQNGVCEEEEAEEEEAPVAAESPEAGEQPAEPEGTVTEEYTETIEVEATEFVNRQFIPESTYSSTENDHVEEWTAEAQVVNSMQHQPPVALTQEPLHTVNPMAPSPTPDPVVRKQVVQDLMAQLQGTYNFMQDSMLELDPAIVSAQPMKPAQTVDLQQIGLGHVHPETRLPQTSTVPGQADPSPVSIVSPTPEAFSSTPSLYQPTLTTEPHPQTEPIDPIQASMSLSSEQTPVPSSLPSAFPPASKVSHSGGINVNAAPFQSMQAVFNMNAPVPPADDGQGDNLKQPAGQFPVPYSQGFTSQSEHGVEQGDSQQEALQSVVGGFQDPALASTGSHQAPLSQQGSQGAGFARSGQSFYNSRGAPRGGPRNARGMINGYRGSSNGFRGGYDGYRPPFSNTPNSGYGQTQFNAPRDYSNGTYQREGYQQGYKRGAAQGPRGVSRGRGGYFKPSRGMNQN